MKPASFNVIKRVFAVWIVAVLSACSSPSEPRSTDIQIIDPAATSLPALAAEFVTTRTGDGHPVAPEPVVWRLWRDNQQIITERPQLAIGELWQRDGQTVMHRKLYHTDQRAIEFQLDDLKMLQAAPSWQKLSLILDLELLQQLTAGDIEWLDGHPLCDYQGNLLGTEWHVVMRMDLALPSLIERRQGEYTERTELLKAYALSQSPWQPTAADSYEIIDYADLGDRETDPFVIKVQAQMGHEH